FRRQGVSESLLITIARPLPLHYPFRVLPANLHGTVGAEGIHHDNLIAPAQAVETRADIPLFVETDDNGGDHGACPDLGILGRHVSSKIESPVQIIKLELQLSCKVRCKVTLI